jgi:DNA-binding response OmpR family regulator
MNTNSTQNTILMVEDNEDIINMNRQILSGTGGYEVHTATLLSEAREKLTMISPDIILLDINLPDGNGFDFCKEIRPKTEAYIIFVTGNSTDADRLRGVDSGGDAYLTKPYNMFSLLENIETGIKKAMESAV